MRTLALIISLGFSFTLAAPLSAVADTVQLREDAPDRHTVVKGDTLWDISAKFLKSPWLWPELWQTNKDHIKNPHLIYPGDVVYLVMTPDGPRLTRMETVKLSPSVHAEPLKIEDAIPTIPHATVRAFLRRPLLDDGDAMAAAPKLIGTEDDRGLVTMGNRVYADKLNADTPNWNIVRVGKALKDPASGAVLARETEYVGSARVRTAGSPASLELLGTEREIMMGDRLVPATDMDKIDFVPHAPGKAVDGRIISAFGASQTAYRYATVIIDMGRADGLEPGHVLAISHPGKTVGRVEGEPRTTSFNPKSGYLDSAKERGHNQPYADLQVLGEKEEKPQRWLYKDSKCLKADAPNVLDSSYDPAKVMEECKGEPNERRWTYLDIGCIKPGKQITYGEPFDPKEVYDLHCRSTDTAMPATRLPDVRTGLVLVYRTFDKVSYALVMESYGPLYLLDHVGNP